MTDTVDRTVANTRTERAATVVRKRRRLELRRLGLDGSSTHASRAFTKPRITVGRSRACDLVVADPSVSPLHFELRVRGEHVELRDLQSATGTRLGERRIYRVELWPGDHFSAGDVEFELLKASEIEVALSAEDRFEEMWGISSAIREVFARLDALAGATLDVLIAGETGTGKGLAARSLHLRSGRPGRFVVLDCGTATASGLVTAFQEAEGGTLLLDDLAELPSEEQPRLLRLLDRRESEAEAESASADPSAPTGVRIVATTRADVSTLAATHRFREDLYFRVAQAVVELPPLRERGDDVELLAAHFIAEHASSGGAPLELTHEARVALREHPWPGNVRELRNVIQRAAHLARGPQILPADLALRNDGDLMGMEELLALPYREAHGQLDRYYLRRVMAETRGNITHAAQRVGTSRRSLRERLKRLGLYANE